LSPSKKSFVSIQHLVSSIFLFIPIYHKNTIPYNCYFTWQSIGRSMNTMRKSARGLKKILMAGLFSNEVKSI
jgi:hypothetical protein